MARALAGGMLSSGLVKEPNLTVVDPSADSAQWWAQTHPEVSFHQSMEDASPLAKIVVLAVKPNVIMAATDQPAGTWQGRLVISIAAGVSLKQLTTNIHHDRIVRVMPNSPSLVGQGASAYCVGEGVQTTDMDVVESLLRAVGECVRVDESQMDAVTGLSGSGPAYIFTIIEGLADGGVSAGLSRSLAMKLATQTVLGAASMVHQTGRHPGELKDAVASPGGTTIAGLNVLESRAIRSAMAEAVKAATRRSHELGQS